MPQYQNPNFFHQLNTLVMFKKCAFVSLMYITRPNRCVSMQEDVFLFWCVLCSGTLMEENDALHTLSYFYIYIMSIKHMYMKHQSIHEAHCKNMYMFIMESDTNEPNP